MGCGVVMPDAFKVLVAPKVILGSWAMVQLLVRYGGLF